LTPRLRALAALAAVGATSLAVVGGVGVMTGTLGGTAAAIDASLGPQGRVPQFKVECAWSHAAPDDPIVHPGAPGRSHLHDFFGNKTTNAGSTVGSLLAGDTTCQNKLDTAAYWAPALLRDGEPVTPAGAVAYYRPGPGVDPASVRPFPVGLMMVAGDAEAASQPMREAAWHCGASPNLVTNPPVCPRTAPLGVRIAFPDCWDGEHLDSDDHRAHVARSRGGRCPADHPVAIPRLVFEVHYPVTGDPTGLELASGSVEGVHADFLNAWDQPTLEREVRICLNGAKVCGVVSNRATG
jgi:Domain of unknown function (DUF1996)